MEYGSVFFIFSAKAYFPLSTLPLPPLPCFHGILMNNFFFFLVLRFSHFISHSNLYTITITIFLDTLIDQNTPFYLDIQ